MNVITDDKAHTAAYPPNMATSETADCNHSRLASQLEEHADHDGDGDDLLQQRGRYIHHPADRLSGVGARRIPRPP